VHTAKIYSEITVKLQENPAVNTFAAAVAAAERHKNTACGSTLKNWNSVKSCIFDK